MVSGTRCPYVILFGCEVVRGAAAPKGPMTYAVFIAFREHIHFLTDWTVERKFLQYLSLHPDDRMLTVITMSIKIMRTQC